MFFTLVPITCFINFRYVLQCCLHSVFKCLLDIRVVFALVGTHVLFVLLVFIYAYRCQPRFPYQTYVSFTIVTIGPLKEQEQLTGPKNIRLPPLFSGVRTVLSIVLYSILSIVVFVFVCFFSIDIMRFLRITASDYPFCIFTILLQIEHPPPQWKTTN